jgi:hypothetical protein
VSGELTVFTTKNSLLRRRNRAVTLIEAVLYISIALALIVGGLVFFQQASTAAKTSATVRHISALVAETRVLMKGLPPSAGWFDITPTMIAAGAVPSDMVLSPTSISNPFGGTTELNADPMSFGDPMISVELTNVPKGVCARLLTASSGSGFAFGTGGAGFTTLVSSGTTFTGTRASTAPTGTMRNFVMNATQAGWMCKYGANAYSSKTTEPSTATPLSGNVTVTLWILINA